MPPKKSAEPILKEVTVSYRAAIKANLGDFENADLDITESETWTVTGLTVEQSDDLIAERGEVLKERIDSRVVSFYQDNSKNC
jgi:hypothetical protein